MEYHFIARSSFGEGFAQTGHEEGSQDPEEGDFEDLEAPKPGHLSHLGKLIYIATSDNEVQEVDAEGNRNAEKEALKLSFDDEYEITEGKMTYGEDPEELEATFHDEMMKAKSAQRARNQAEFAKLEIFVFMFLHLQ